MNVEKIKATERGSQIIKNVLSKNLRNHLKIESYKNILLKIPFFNGCNVETINALCLKVMISFIFLIKIRTFYY